MYPRARLVVSDLAGLVREASSWAAQLSWRPRLANADIVKEIVCALMEVPPAVSWAPAHKDVDECLHMVFIIYGGMAIGRADYFAKEEALKHRASRVSADIYYSELRHHQKVNQHFSHVMEYMVMGGAWEGPDLPKPRKFGAPVQPAMQDHRLVGLKDGHMQCVDYVGEVDISAGQFEAVAHASLGADRVPGERLAIVEGVFEEKSSHCLFNAGQFGELIEWMLFSDGHAPFVAADVREHSPCGRMASARVAAEGALGPFYSREEDPAAAPRPGEAPSAERGAAERVRPPAAAETAAAAAGSASLAAGLGGLPSVAFGAWPGSPAGLPPGAPRCGPAAGVWAAPPRAPKPLMSPNEKRDLDMMFRHQERQGGRGSPGSAELANRKARRSKKQQGKPREASCHGEPAEVEEEALREALLLELLSPEVAPGAAARKAKRRARRRAKPADLSEVRRPEAARGEEAAEAEEEAGQDPRMGTMSRRARSLMTKTSTQKWRTPSAKKVTARKRRTMRTQRPQRIFTRMRRTPMPQRLRRPRTRPKETWTATRRRPTARTRAAPRRATRAGAATRAACRPPPRGTSRRPLAARPRSPTRPARAGARPRPRRRAARPWRRSRHRRGVLPAHWTPKRRRRLRQQRPRRRPRPLASPRAPRVRSRASSRGDRGLGPISWIPRTTSWRPLIRPRCSVCRPAAPRARPPTPGRRATAPPAAAAGAPGRRRWRRAPPLSGRSTAAVAPRLRRPRGRRQRPSRAHSTLWRPSSCPPARFSSSARRRCKSGSAAGCRPRGPRGARRSGGGAFCPRSVLWCSRSASRRSGWR
ncbi:unnamed protein product [Prorocentrum cordatum]|uniref:Uncharacterized protein n=1 Tax=Prorocentrum cordatum TaxID=2364126 RepID=A0ABN9WWM3_9DINO|nr:unnamed protein product [Polarella glacialis]